MSISVRNFAFWSQLLVIVAGGFIPVACSDDSSRGQDLSVNPDRGQDRPVREARGDAPSPDAASIDGQARDVLQADTQSPCFTLGGPQASSTGPKGKADILFVIDNSSGMAPFQQALLGAIPTLEAALKSPASTADFHIGVVTTDLGAGPYTLPNCHLCGDNGRLHQNPSLCPMGNLFMTNSYWGTMAENFQCLASAGEQGCGFEQPLESAAIFLTTQSISAGFLRPDASLVIVVVTNEDDCSAKDRKLFDPSDTSLGLVDSFRCFQHGITCNINDPTQPGPRTNCTPIVGGKLRDVSSYASLFKSTKPAGRVGLVVLAGPPTPVSVSFAGSNADVNPSCKLALVVASAAPGIRLKALTDAFGSLGKFHSICGSFSAAMTDVATMAHSL